MPNDVPVYGHCAPRFERVRQALQEKLNAGAEVGASIAFTLNGESVVDLWGGFLSADRDQEWERDTIVNTYSTTKGMTALCAHRLVEAGSLDLDAPVAHYWPEFAAAGKSEIPVRWLLSHQAGLPTIREKLPAEALYDWNTICAALAETEPSWTPGEKHGYHPVTYGFLVGEVIRRVSGRSVGKFFREEFANPLGADFHIGLAPEHHGRVSNLIGSLLGPPPKPPNASGASGTATMDATKKKAVPQKGPLAEFMRDIRDASTMIGGAFNNPPIRSGAHNTPQWRKAEIPAANGHGNARALARIYGGLACGGSVDGIHLLKPQSILRARTEQVQGPDLILGGIPTRYGLGFMLRSKSMPLSPNESAFGHPGAGGSIGMADPDARVGFGYTMNEMHVGLLGGATGFAAIKAFYEAL